MTYGEEGKTTMLTRVITAVLMVLALATSVSAQSGETFTYGDPAKLECSTDNGTSWREVHDQGACDGWTEVRSTYNDGTVVTTYRQSETVESKSTPDGTVLPTGSGGPGVWQDPIAEPPLFVAGETIGAVTYCLPQFTVPSGASPCYGEVLTIKAVRSDGWLFVTDEQGAEWYVNTASIYSFQRNPRQAPLVATRPVVGKVAAR